jgi:hypothetical protein
MSTLETDKIEFVFPAVSDDFLSEWLRSLTKRLYVKTGAPWYGGFLGGEYGYGVNFENDVFMMHPYCWCDYDDCKWCAHDAPNFEHKATGATVHWYKYIGRDMEADPDADWRKIMQECDDSIGTQ